jgi:hypothetical protein
VHVGNIGEGNLDKAVKSEDSAMKYIIRTKPFPGAEAEPQSYWIPQDSGTYVRSADIKAALARGFSSEADARAYMDAHNDPKGVQNEIIGVE